MNRFKAFVATLILVAVPLCALAQLKPGTDYVELKSTQPTEAQGKVEVIEFFWYACVHCYSLEPALESWVKKLPADVQFKRVPVIFGDREVPHARIYYAFESLGVAEKVHKSFFDALHKERLNIANEPAMNAWLEKNGIDRKKFDDAIKSFGVQAKVKRAAQLSTAYKIDGVPMLAIQGKYTVAAADSPARMLANTEQVIDIARKDLGKK